MSRLRSLLIFGVLVAGGLGAALLFFHERETVEPANGPSRDGARHETDADATLQGRPVAAGPTRMAAPEVPSPEDLAEGDVLLRGRVVGPDGHPSPGAVVEVAHEETVVAGGRSTAEGAFALHLASDRIAGTWRGRLFAADAEGHRAIRVVFWGPRPGPGPRVRSAVGPVVDVGVMRLLRTSGLDIEVRFPAGATAPATVREGAPDQGFIHSFVSLGAHRTDENGRLRLEALPEGTLRLLALAPGSGRWSGFVTLPREEGGSLVIDLPSERIVTVEVVDAATEAPIVGAEVAATESIQAPGTSYSTRAAWWPPLDPALTDAKGRLVIRGLAPDQRLRITANAEGYPHVPSSGAGFGTARLEADVTHVRLELPPPRTARWPIEEGPVPPPDEGAVIAIRPAPGTYLADVQIPQEGRIESGDLVVGGWPPGYLYGLAVAPDGSIAWLYAKDDTDTGTPTTFLPARRVEVVLRYPDGEPVEGFFVHLRNQGNNPVAPPAPTDAEGRAVIEGLYGGAHTLVQVHASEQGTPWGGALLGTVDLEQGDGHVEGVVERTREAVLRFTLAGERRLPPEPSIGLAGTRPPRTTRDEETGTIRCSWRPVPGRSEARLSVEAEGWLPFTTKVAVPPVGTPLVVDVGLEPAGAFVVRVEVPEDGQVRVTALRWSAGKETWERLWLPMTRMGGYAKPDANGRIRFAPLATGRYRALDTTSGIATTPVEVTPGGDEAEVGLDAGRSGWARGKVVVPEGGARIGAVVHVDGVEAFPNVGTGIPGAQGIVARVREDGTFWIRVPGDREVVLRPEALTLRPHAKSGTARVTEPRDDIVLELVRDHTASVTLDRAIPTYGPQGRGITRTVLLYAGEIEGEPAVRTTAAVEDEGRTLVFGGFEPGTYAVWIDADPFAPLVLPLRVLGEGTTDLGEVSGSDGASVVLELLLPAGQAAPRAYGWAEHAGEPAYQRRVNWQGPRAVLTGLGPGRHRITVGSMGGGLHHVETIEIAEGEERTITIDQR